MTPYQRSNTYRNYHLCVIRTKESLCGKLSFYLKEYTCIQLNYFSLRLFSFYYKNFGYKKGDFPIAEKYAQEALSLPMCSNLKTYEQKYLIKTNTEFYNRWV